MSRIQILPESLANQIAAGEVVERPASVVKELLENAIDAGATAIEIHIEGAGTRSIRVIDNGSGMDADDILLSLERHATSKLTSVEQLASISTLGFRGEAIPSIASVSKVTITSRPSSAELGSIVYVHFGSIKKVHDMGCAAGTMIEVKDLFGNVPARRKFLKTAQTELAHIDEMVRSYCLANPHIGFTYQVGGKTVLQLLENADSAQSRFQAIIDSKVELITLGQTDSGKVTVKGFLVPPDQALGKSAKLWSFVNGRFVKDRLVSHAVSEGMQGFMMKGRKAGGLIFVEIDLHEVDVNVHPTKQEVRFRNSGLVHRAISSSVAAGLKGYQQQLRESVFGVPVPAPKKEIQETFKEMAAENEAVSPELETKVSDSILPESFSSVDGRREHSIFKKPLFPQTTVKEQSTAYESAAPVSSAVQVDTNKTDVFKVASCETHAEETGPQPRLIGQLFGTYILCEVEDGFIVVDQHAAQERLFYEELKAQYTNACLSSQVLLFPVMVDLSAAEITILEQYDEEVKRLGLDVQEFGGETYVVNAIPASLSMLSGEEVLRDILDQFADDAAGHSESRLDLVLATMACKASIKAGHKLQDQEIKSLLAQMQRAGVFSHCPHGRPVVKKFSAKDVQKWFYRT